MSRRNRQRIAHAQAVESRGFAHVRRLIQLVDHGYYRLAASAQPVGDLHIQRDRALPAVKQKNNHLGFLNGQIGLAAHLPGQGIVPIKADSARIDKNETLSLPFSAAVKAIPCNSGLLLLDGRPRRGKAVE